VEVLVSRTDPNSSPKPNPHPRAAAALKSAAAAAVDDSLLKIPLSSPALPQPQPADSGAAPRNMAQHIGPPKTKTNPPPPPANGRNPRPLKPIQLTGARLLLQGEPTQAVAATLGVHRYTVSRWKSDPRFQAELRRQVDRAAQRNTAQHGATVSRPIDKTNLRPGDGRPGVQRIGAESPGLNFAGCIPGASAQNGGRARDGPRGGADRVEKK
jgi:hypothetical protein